MEFNLRDQVLSYSRLMKRVLTPMPSSDTLVPSWFDTVENVFERYMVPGRLRGYLVRPYFTESMRALVNRLNVGERSGYGAVKERVLLELRLSRAKVWRPFIETTTSLTKKHKNPRQGIIPENSRVKCFKCKELGHLSRECPRKKTPDEELLFHKKRTDAENVTVEEDSSREPDKVTTDVGKTDGNNLDHQGQNRPDPSVREAPQILFQADDTKRSSKNNCSCVSVQADVDDRNELNVSRAWRTSKRAEDDHDEQVNVDDERPYTLPGWQASRRSEDDPSVIFDNIEAGFDILPELRKFLQANDDHVENMGTFWQADDDHGEDVGVDKQSDILVGRLTSQRAGENVRESGDSDEDAVFELKSSQNITRDADEDSTTCQPATCETDGSAEDVDNGDRLRGPFLIHKIHAKGDKEGTDLTLSCLPESGRGGGPSGRAGPHVRAVGCPREQSPRAGAQGPALSFSLSAGGLSLGPKEVQPPGGRFACPRKVGGHGGEAGDARVSSQDGCSPKARNGALRLAVGQLGARFPRPKGLIREVERAAPTIPPSSRS
ncbi:hypothetical protein HPB47_014320 [Ixodes persulcatus]|uniref:Uncharacterized protein n=1 Tax=Ixodes persulcatus TaxID=34615 RepID=A0AC60QWA0_IXOPE|nr:hypothetical protein HPB47_014320 [Ixodes persulcatus]